MFNIVSQVESMGGTVSKAILADGGRTLKLTVEFSRAKRVAGPKPVRITKTDRDFVAELKKSGQWEEIVKLAAAQANAAKAAELGNLKVVKSA